MIFSIWRGVRNDMSVRDRSLLMSAQVRHILDIFPPLYNTSTFFNFKLTGHRFIFSKLWNVEFRFRGEFLINPHGLIGGI